jgi:AraC-like DNA-binding protein
LGLAKELGSEGVRVNAIRPGLIDTDIHASGGEPDRAFVLGPTAPMGRPGTAEEIAAAAIWLISDAASYVTGALLDVSGGRWRRLKAAHAAKSCWRGLTGSKTCTSVSAPIGAGLTPWKAAAYFVAKPANWRFPVRGVSGAALLAKALGLTERTLTQKLGEENTSYNDVIDQLRRSLALEYMKETSISVAQIAWLLGYEGPTSFNNAFARWTGRSAIEARSSNQRSEDGKVSKLGCAP